jgi:hypothetical protein
MTSRFATKALFCTLLLVAASAVPAWATSFTATQTLTHHFASLDGATGLVFDGFDSNLGTLTDVHIEMELDETLNSTVFNTLGTPQSVGSPTPVFASATTSVSGPAGLFLSYVLTTTGYVGSVAPGINTVGTTSVSGATTSNTLFGNPILLAAYIGGVTTVNISLTSIGTQGGSVSGTAFTGNNGFADVDVRLYYSYDALEDVPGVPEPASLSLLGGGLIAAAWRIRRRKTSVAVTK